MASSSSSRKHAMDDDNSETDSDCSESPRKKVVGLSQKKYGQKFLERYSDTPGIKPSMRGPSHVHCIYCKHDFSIEHSGKYDIQRHVTSNTHINKAKAAKSNKSISDMFSQHTMPEAGMQVIKAETLMTDLIVDLNLPITAADRFNKVLKKAFPDSKIAQNYECGRSKTTAIIKCMATHSEDKLVSKMRSGPYSFSTDGSNDQKNKQFPIVVTYPSEHGVSQELLSVPVLAGSATGKNIFDLIFSKLKERDVPINNCLAFGTDNANVMVGRNKGVFAFLLKENPQIHLAGCPCHLLHHAAEHAAQCLPFSIDDVLVRVYYYLDKSSKRLGALDECQELFDVEHRNILKHCPTRWLSVTTCLDRLLENWVALKKFFHNELKNQKASTQEESVPEKMDKFFRSPTNKLYCLFLQYAIKPFTSTNIKLQEEAPLIHKLQRVIRGILKDLMLRFVAPWAFTSKTIDEVQFNIKVHQRKDSDLFIGEAAKEYISKKDEVHLKDSRIVEFYSAVRNFYQAGTKYIKDKLPQHDQLLEKVQVADVALRTRYSFSNITYFTKRYPCLIPPDCTIDELELEYACYQTMDIPEAETLTDRIDHIWLKLGKIKDEAGQYILKNLSTFMLGLLTIPHSNAPCERIFSCVRKNKTDQRATLGSDTLNALMVCKSRPKGEAETDDVRHYSIDELKNFKSAYSQSLKKK